MREVAPPDPGDDEGTIIGPNLSDRLSGDPSHELFGHGWTPRNERPTSPDSYTGRHRAKDD